MRKTFAAVHVQGQSHLRTSQCVSDVLWTLHSKPFGAVLQLMSDMILAKGFSIHRTPAETVELQFARHYYVAHEPRQFCLFVKASMCFANKVGRQHCLLSGSFRDIHFREVLLFHVVRVRFDILVQVRHRSNIVSGASGLQQTRERLATTVCPAHLRLRDAMDILSVVDNFQA